MLILVKNANDKNEYVVPAFPTHKWNWLWSQSFSPVFRLLRAHQYAAKAARSTPNGPDKSSRVLSWLPAHLTCRFNGGYIFQASFLLEANKYHDYDVFMWPEDIHSPAAALHSVSPLADLHNIPQSPLTNGDARSTWPTPRGSTHTHTNTRQHLPLCQFAPLRLCNLIPQAAQATSWGG